MHHVHACMRAIHAGTRFALLGLNGDALTSQSRSSYAFCRRRGRQRACIASRVIAQGAHATRR